MSKWNYGEGKTYTSVSEAFRDVDYATPLWKCETEFDRSMNYLKWGVMWVVVLGVLYLFSSWFNDVVMWAR